MPAFEPDPFGAGHVQERSEDRFVTDAKVASQMFFRQLRRRIHRKRIGPLCVIEKVPDI